ncbi:hypothetical protein Btru_050965 [Bulinus truncatus]|nr:hypothetical protein Btru_050965 [Bulinus truncatus]
MARSRYTRLVLRLPKRIQISARKKYSGRHHQFSTPPGTAMFVLLMALVYPVAVTCQQTTMEAVRLSTTTASPKPDAMLGGDYEYVHAGVNYKQRAPWAAPRPNLGGAPTLGEKYEWLVGRLKSMRQRGTLGQVEELQKLFPNINVTQVYHSLPPSRAGAEEDERGWRAAGHHNSTYYKEEEDEMEGHWVNGTLQPGEGPEMDDAYYYNGSWYMGVREMEDGRYVNGTWHPAPGEADEGYMLNGTWREENEVEEGQGQEEEYEWEEKLMWWQLHHPKWRDGGNNEGGANGEKTAKHEQQQQERKSGVVIPLVAPAHLPTHPTRQQSPHPQQSGPNSMPQYQRPQYLPRYQRPQSLPQYQRPPNRQAGGDKPVAREQRPGALVVENQPIQSKMTGDRGSNPLISSAVEPQISAGGAALQRSPESPVIKKTPPKDNGMSSTMSWGIAIACFIAVTFILAPLACILYKYRQEKRIKKRTFLKRPEHGSVDEGIMDAMVMSELGEVRNSRVKSVVGRKPGPGRQATRDGRSSREQGSRRSSSASLSLSRLRSERQPLSMVELGDGPEILIV